MVKKYWNWFASYNVPVLFLKFKFIKDVFSFYQVSTDDVQTLRGHNIREIRLRVGKKNGTISNFQLSLKLLFFRKGRDTIKKGIYQNNIDRVTEYPRK